jgi:carboxymethylenebutenolidase
MGEIVEFASNGSTGHGYLAPASSGAGPGVIVIQEWWGLVPHIHDVCDRLAAEGITALAPDLYRGEQTTEPDEAGKLMMALNIDEAADHMSGAVDYLGTSEHVHGDEVGVVGFCMGGGLALVLGCHRPDKVKAVVPFYGLIPWAHAQPDYSKLSGPVQGHYAQNDGMFGPEAVAELDRTLADAGVEHELFSYPGTDHAFLNDTRPEVYDAEAAHTAWVRTLDFFRMHLG